MGPRLLGLAAGQLNFIVSTVLASNLGVGSVTAYNYAFQLSQIPVGVLGVSVAVALFPTFSRDAALGHIAEIRRQLSTSLRILIFLAAPLTAVMIVLARPIAAVFFQYGLFSTDAADRTASALVFFSIGLAGHIVVHVLTRAFYAMQDTRVPVFWAVVAVAINVPLMAILSGPMGVEGLALALSISAIARGARPGLGPAAPDRLDRRGRGAPLRGALAAGRGAGRGGDARRAAGDAGLVTRPAGRWGRAHRWRWSSWSAAGRSSTCWPPRRCAPRSWARCAATCPGRRPRASAA